MPTSIDPQALRRKDTNLANLGATQGTILNRVISRAFEDIDAHALNALTQTLKKATDGRPTLAAVRQSRGYASAKKRLESLWEGLVILLQADREQLYTQAYRGWSKILPAETLNRSTGEPSQAEITKFRNFIFQGTTLNDWLWVPVRRAIEGLESTLTVAGGSEIPDDEAESLLAGWSDRAKNGILASAQTALSDSLYLSDRVAGRNAIRPDLLHPDPTLGD